MRGSIISYDYLCQKESAKLQKGMNFRLKGRHSVLLMSVRKNSPYQDEITDDGTVLIYEGHDVPKTEGVTYPKQLDQPEYLSSGNLTENGKFNKAAEDYKSGKKGPDIIQVYEKIKAGIWSWSSSSVTTLYRRNIEVVRSPIFTLSNQNQYTYLHKQFILLYIHHSLF
mgnify:CR=1 FL=1